MPYLAESALQAARDFDWSWWWNAVLKGRSCLSRWSVPS